jgi:hypothetical protein
MVVLVLHMRTALVVALNQELSMAQVVVEAVQTNLTEKALQTL